METSVFTDKSARPDNAQLAKALEGKGRFWEAIKSHIENNYGHVTEEWKFYGAKSGWVLKLLLKKRNLFFFTPLKGDFRLGFVFGDRAVSAVEKSDLPENIISALKNAKKYVEGRGLRVEVKSAADVEDVKKLIEIKVRN
jgi:hypothetical protein